MAALMRGIVYASLFIGFFLVFLPSRVLQWSGIPRPAVMGIPQVAGVVMVVLGGALALSCILAFALIGRGTPAPFDPPRRLVVRGPYRFVRNPMYLGATLALLGAATVYESMALHAFTALFFVTTHLFVRLYEEPTLSRLFGAEYQEYQKRVRRWWPRRPSAPNETA